MEKITHGLFVTIHSCSRSGSLCETCTHAKARSKIRKEYSLDKTDNPDHACTPCNVCIM